MRHGDATMSAESSTVVSFPSAASDQAKWRRPGAAILSRLAGEHPAAEELQGQLLFLDTGELFVDSTQRTNPRVLEYMAELQRKHLRIKVVLVDGAVLTQIAWDIEGEPVHSIIAVEETSAKQDEVLAMLREALARRASDIHIQVDKTGADVRYRVDGAMTFIRRLPRREEALMLCRTIYQAMTDVAEPVLKPSSPQDARLKGEFLQATDLNGCRVGTVPSDQGMDMVLRLMPKPKVQTSMEMLGFHPLQEAIFERLTQRKTGVNVFSGATGSGKTTALALMMENIARNFHGELKLYSLENPPEKRMAGVTQVPVHNDNWAERLRGILRVDPDVIMVGEMRDQESSTIALQAALTGHGVWSTVHANDAVAILQRFKMWGLDPGVYTDPRVVTGLINQSLVRKLCDNCKVMWTASAASKNVQLGKRLEARCSVENVHVRGVGCAQCKGTGTLGRTVACEVIAPNVEFMRLFAVEGPAAARNYWRTSMHGITKLDHLITKIEAGIVDPEIGESTLGQLIDEEERLGEGSNL
ncbi:hypothetical protein EGJ89_09920 [Stenotrophomonas maltophilia]|nr:hypothetical protein EGJ89_09920 [Stenotrophomonas maltophilia]